MTNDKAARTRPVHCGGTGFSRTGRTCAREGTPQLCACTRARASIGGVFHAK